MATTTATATSTAGSAPITLSFNLDGQQRVIEVRSSGALRDPNEVCPEAVDSNTAVGFSGRHDHGELVKLKTAGPLLELGSSIQDAKAACDQHLTEMIRMQEQNQPEKRARIEPANGAAHDGADGGAEG